MQDKVRKYAIVPSINPPVAKINEETRKSLLLRTNGDMKVVKRHTHNLYPNIPADIQYGFTSIWFFLITYTK